MKATIKSLLSRAAKALDTNTALTAKERAEVLDDINAALDSEKGTPWWVVVLKVLAYAIGLILAGYGTTAAITTWLVPFF